MNGSDSTEVVEPSGEYFVRCDGEGKGGFGNELIRLIVEIVLKIVAKEESEEGRLEMIVLAQSGGSLSGEESSAVGRIVNSDGIGVRNEETDDLRGAVGSLLSSWTLTQ